MRKSYGLVSLPYEFTLFSNKVPVEGVSFNVSLPYEFTLFSNPHLGLPGNDLFHYLMNLHYSQTDMGEAMKYAAFHYLMNLHYSQTFCISAGRRLMFHYLMDLHYSQT